MENHMKTILVTGANRGLGLEFVKQYTAAGWRVHACCREPESARILKQLAAASNGAIAVHTLDVADFAQIDRLADALSSETIDLLLNNAGIYPDRGHSTFGETDYNAWADGFRVNTMAPLKMVEAFVEHVACSDLKKIALVTSKMGSVADNTSGAYYIYRSSKSALNMVARSLALDLAPRGIAVALLHPGWVQTDMGGPNAWITPEQSIKGMRKSIDKVTLEDSGVFYAYDGQQVPW
jgi:NAD(P)-dependent dehydrogenase (short-subunit alcohol dehydrogenase family)